MSGAQVRVRAPSQTRLSDLGGGATNSKILETAT